MEKRLILILGGARSGKSTFSERLAAEMGKRVLFVATATVEDEEMRLRVEAHQRARAGHWRTLEVPRGVGAAIERERGDAQVVLLDCLSLLASNVLVAEAGEEPSEGDVLRAERELEREVAGLVDAYEAGGASLIVVSNEVGLGLVPPYPLGRAYRDALGRANQFLAARADRVFLMIAGLAVDLKALSAAMLPAGS